MCRYKIRTPNIHIIKAKGIEQRLLLKGKDNCFYFAKGQTVQTSVHTPKKDDNTSFKCNNLLKEGWPNLKCQIVDMFGLEEVVVE